MPAPTSSPLKALVHLLVPASATSPSLTRELLDYAQEILDSNLSAPPQNEDMVDLANLIQRHLSQTSSSSGPSLRLTNLLSRLIDQPTLSRKWPVLYLLYVLSQQDLPAAPSRPPPAASASNSRRTGPSPFLPSLETPPSDSASHPSSAHHRQNGHPPPQPPEFSEPAGQPSLTSKAALLKAYRQRIGKVHVPTSNLLRDAIYLLQGISGQYVQFSSVPNADLQQENGIIFVEAQSAIISPPNRVLLHRIAELGHLYRLITGFLEERSLSSDVGLIEQSLHHELRSHLTEYHKLIALLESHASRSTDDSGGLTLMRLEAWVGEWRLRLRLMSVLVEGSKDAHGGKLVSLIHAHTSNGDPFIKSFTAQILEQVSKPFFVSLQAWLFSGSVDDPFGEFFVVPGERMQGKSNGHPGAPNDDEAADVEFDGEDYRTWQDKWQFKRDMMPSFLNETFGRKRSKVYSTGKSLNFIRYNCHDTDWITTQANVSASLKTLKYSDIPGLEQSIDSAYRIASQRLFDAFFVKYKLMDHLQALKAYLLCGYGDFADLLMETLSTLLARPANALYRHTLTASLLTAVKGSNAQYDPPDVLARLDARMLEYSHGEIGWDVFTLEYKLDAPIDTVLDPDTMGNYLKLFNHIWKMRRVEASLVAGWAKAVGTARTFMRVPELETDWHQVRILIAEMTHFVRQMHSWSQREVIASSWKDLMAFIHKKEGDLDELIAAHSRYLDRMVKKVLLFNPKPGKEENYLSQVREIFTTILQFQEAMDDLYRYTFNEAARRDREKDEERGVYTGSADEGRRSTPGPDNLQRILGRVKEYGSGFSERAAALVISLNSHPDLDVRFLAISLSSFSNFYHTRREQQKG